HAFPLAADCFQCSFRGASNVARIIVVSHEISSVSIQKVRIGTKKCVLTWLQGMEYYHVRVFNQEGRYV
ncbi:hypothetical protein MNBD_GAMMA15-708, partial [hydrothermal vent metagenome]